MRVYIYICVCVQYTLQKRFCLFMLGMRPMTLQEDNPALALDVQTVQRIFRSSWMSPPERAWEQSHWMLALLLWYETTLGRRGPKASSARFAAIII